MFEKDAEASTNDAASCAGTDTAESVPKSDMFEIDADDQHTVQQVVRGPMRLKVYMGQSNP